MHSNFFAYLIVANLNDYQEKEILLLSAAVTFNPLQYNFVCIVKCEIKQERSKPRKEKDRTAKG